MRMRVLAAGAAGLLVTTAGAGASTTTSTAMTTAFYAPVVVTSDDVREPGIDIAPDGTVYLAAVAALGEPSPIFRSDDGGLAFVRTPPGLRAAAPGGSGIDLTVSPAGALAITDNWGGNSTVARSTDRGQSWTVNPVQGPPVQNRPWVAAGGGVVYHVVQQLTAGLVLSRSGDGGVTYGPGTVVAAPDTTSGSTCLCPPGNLVVAAGAVGAKVGLVYATGGGGVRFTRSVNGGLTFATSVVRPVGGADTLQGYPTVADAGNGTLAVAWMEVAGQTSRTGFSVSSDWGGTWSAPRYVVATGTSAYPWVAARGGKVGISLFHTSAAGTPGTVPSTAQWFEKYVESLDGGASWSVLQTVDTTPVKTGPICTGGVSCAEDGELGGFQTLAYDSLGRPYLAYTRSVDGHSNTELRLVRGA